jgi:hypothetical protein
VDIKQLRSRGERTRRILATQAFVRRMRERIKDLQALLFHQRISWIPLHQSQHKRTKHKRRARPQEHSKKHPLIYIAKKTEQQLKQRAKYIKAKKGENQITQKEYVLRRLKEVHSD